MRARWVAEAETELRAASQWYEDRKEGLGAEFLEAAVDGLLEIEKHPLRFAKPPKVRTTREVRRYLIGRFPYAIIYQVREREIRVVAIAHSSQKPGYWRGRLK